MRIKLKLFAGLRGLAGDNRRGETELELPDGTTPAGLIAHLKIDPRMAQVMLVNGRQATDPSQALPDGAEVDILPPVAGG
jgi:molybdopterin converting factor small subunit